MRPFRLAFIGTGRMGSALIGGIIRSGLFAPGSISVHDKEPKASRRTARTYRVRLARSNGEAARSADIVFLCVKPSQVPEVLAEIAGAFSGSSRRPRTVVASIAAGIPIRKLEGALPKGTPVVRIMPNTPALLGVGASALSRGRWATPAHLRAVEKLLQAVGKTVILPERDLDAVTAVSGSGPAYVFYLAEAMREACRDLGLPEAAAEMLCRQTVHGAGEMLARLGASPRELRALVTSPGGTTEAAVKELEMRRVRLAIRKAIIAAARRARELSRDAR